MYRIRRLGIQGFRRLRDLSLELRPLNVLIGANGVGKTSLLDAFSLLSASAGGRLSTTLSDFGGAAEVLTRGKKEALLLSAELEDGRNRTYDYQLILRPQGGSYRIFLERLCQLRESRLESLTLVETSGNTIQFYDPEKKRQVRADWEHNAQETALSQVPRSLRKPEEIRGFLASATYYHVLDVGKRAPVKLPQQMKPALLPGPNGEDLLSLLYYLRESEPARYEALVDTLRAAFPDFEALGFPPVAAGMMAMTWKDKNFGQPLYMNELSEGTLRFLWLAALLQSPGLSTVTMIDEPEVSLHPELLGLLAELMREASERTQLIIATHSDRLVRFLHPDELVVMDLEEDGSATATRAGSLDLEQWLAEYSLDEVWRMGRIGGRA